MEFDVETLKRLAWEAVNAYYQDPIQERTTMAIANLNAALERGTEFFCEQKEEGLFDAA